MWVKTRGLQVVTCPRECGNSGDLDQAQLVLTDAMLAQWCCCLQVLSRYQYVWGGLPELVSSAFFGASLYLDPFSPSL